MMSLCKQIKKTCKRDERVSTALTAIGITLFVATLWFGSFYHDTIMGWLSGNVLFHGWLLGWAVIAVVVVPFGFLALGFRCCQRESKEHRGHSFKGARHVSAFSSMLSWVDGLGKNSTRVNH